MSLLVVGSVAFDSITSPAGSVERVLGGSATYFSLSACNFAGVQLVAVVGEDFEEEQTKLLDSHGVDLKGLQQERGKTFQWVGDYTRDMNAAVSLETHLNVFEQFNPQIPESYRQAPYVFLANIDPVLQRRVLEQMERPKLVGLDTMNFWISSKLEELKKTISMVDLVTLNDGEILQLTGQRNLLRASKMVMDLGPKIVVVKRGEYGAWLFTPHGHFVANALLLERVVDPTGAGDTFAGGLMGTIAGENSVDEQTLRRGVVNGSIMASFTVEHFGVSGLVDLNREEIRARLQDFELSRIYEGRPLPQKKNG